MEEVRSDDNELDPAPDDDIGDALDEYDDGDGDGLVVVGRKNLGQVEQENVRTRSVKSRREANKATNFSN